MFGEVAPNGMSLFRSSYSSVSAVVVTRKSKSRLFAAAPSSSAKTRDPAAGLPRAKKSVSPIGAIEPSTPQDSGPAAAGVPFGSVSAVHGVTSRLNCVPVEEATSSTKTFTVWPEARVRQATSSAGLPVLRFAAPRQPPITAGYGPAGQSEATYRTTFFVESVAAARNDHAPAAGAVNR